MLTVNIILKTPAKYLHMLTKCLHNIYIYLHDKIITTNQNRYYIKLPYSIILLIC